MVERKLATVIFVDLVGSTALVAGTDPEVARRRVTQFFELVKNRIEAHGGTVEAFAGDAVMAAFGVPISHEDDAERAVRAALEIRAGVGDLGVECRIGIESGEVLTEIRGRGARVGAAGQSRRASSAGGGAERDPRRRRSARVGGSGHRARSGGHAQAAWVFRPGVGLARDLRRETPRPRQGPADGADDRARRGASC
jgi:Adenylate and Guanylate cyclase catalytic domain